MRISMQDSDNADLVTAPLAYPINVYLDGEKLPGCTMADTTVGVVRVEKLNAAGEIYVEPGTNEIAQEYRHGRVRVILAANDRG